MNKVISNILFCLFVVGIFIVSLFFLQDSFFFHPDKKYISPQEISLNSFREEILVSKDKKNIMTWYHEGDKNKAAILFLHGNAGQIAKFAPHLKPIINKGYSLLAMEYRSFGNTEGKITKKNILDDTMMAFDWLKKQGHEKIIVYGYSFGTAFACALTQLRKVDGLILTAPFSSLENLVSEKTIPFAKFLLKEKYLSVESIKNYNAPLLIIHGMKDKLIPYHHSQVLFKNASTKNKRIELLDNEDHISIFSREKNIPFILEYLEQF